MTRWRRRREPEPLPPEALERIAEALAGSRSRDSLTPEEAEAALAALYDNPLPLEDA